MRSAVSMLLVAGSLVGAGCSAIDSPERLFRLHVIQPIPASVKDIRHFKDRCAMHGPMCFRFQASKVDVDQIITKHGLTRVDHSTLAIQEISTEHFNKHVDWWKASNQLENMQIFEKLASLQDGELHARYLYFDGEVAYFITTGFWAESKDKKTE